MKIRCETVTVGRVQKRAYLNGKSTSTMITVVSYGSVHKPMDLLLSNVQQPPQTQQTSKFTVQMN